MDTVVEAFADEATLMPIQNIGGLRIMSEDVFNFSTLIDEYLKREPQERVIGVYRPSEIGTCIRLTYYKFRMPVEFPPDKLRLFKAGDHVHYFIRSVLASSPRLKLVDWEKPFSLVYDDFEISSGGYDDLITVRVQGKPLPIIIEVKSVSGKGVDHIKQPSMMHLYQIHPYMKAAHSNMATIWYVARDTYADKWFTVFYDERIMDEAVARIRKLHWHLVEQILPERECGFLCKFCPFWQECRGDYNPPLKERALGR